MNTEKCTEWSKERLQSNPINPLTNRNIKYNGPTYKKLDEDCKHLIVDINSICMKWLKNNHVDLYMKIKPKKSKKKEKRGPNPPPSASIGSAENSKKKRDYYSVDVRQELGEEVKDYFSTVIIDEGKACMTRSKTLLKFVKRPKLLGYGSFGNVYSVAIPRRREVTVAIKEGRISSTELKKAMGGQYPIEYLFNKLINDLIDDKVCPNFSYTFVIFYCDKCALNEFTNSPVRTQCSETVVELFDYTLDKLTDLRDEVILSILFQILFAISSIQLKYGMFHNDVKKENVLVKTIPAGGYWEYNLHDQTYRVPNYGYIVVLNDFGVSLVYRQGISGRDFGRRQAQVVKGPDNKYYFKPFTTKYYPEVSKSGAVAKIKPHRFKGLTWNHFYKDFDSEPSVPVDLKDMGSFPTYFFHYDVLDTVRMIIGGKRMYQPGDHDAMKVSKNIHDLLKDFYQVKPNQEWPIDRVDLFLADHAIRKLFPFYLNSSDSKLKGVKIEEYFL